MELERALIIVHIGLGLLTAGLVFILLGEDIFGDARLGTLGGFLTLLTGVGFAAVGAGGVFGPSKHLKTKESPYECGSPIQQATRSKFDVRFFMLAMIFILFDIETVLLLPYILQADDFGIPGLIVAAIFFVGLVESLAYAWKKGALDWYQPSSGGGHAKA